MDILYKARLMGRFAGLAYERLTSERLENPKALELYGFKVYSQYDEDGILEEIFNRIGTTNKTFVEFGVENGLESNCHYLLHKGWTGLWIDGSAKYVAEINEKFYPALRTEQLRVCQAFVTKDNINQLIGDAGIRGPIDLLSIDIDGNDYYVWHAIKVVEPRVVVIEYNAKFPPNHDWKQAYNERHTWDGSDWQGASLKALELLGRRLGYRLVGTDISGVNAFFVRDELAGDHFIEPATAEALYNPARFDLYRHFLNGHPARYYLGNQLDNIGVINYRPTEFEKALDDRNKNYLDDAVKQQAWLKFAGLPENMCFAPSKTHSKFYLPNGGVDQIQQMILLSDDYYDGDMLRRAANEVEGGRLSRVLGESGSVVVDVGACIGNRVLFFANELRAEKVIAFEPIEGILSILARNVELNGLNERTELHCCGLSNAIGRTSVQRFNPENIGDTSLLGRDGDIELTTLDSFELPKLTLLSIDAVDMEVEVLEGALETLKRTRPIVLVKTFLYRRPSVEEFFDWLDYVRVKLTDVDYIFLPKD